MQRERRRATERAAAEHAARVRRRLLVGVPVALVVAAAAVAAYLAFAGGPLKDAAERAEDRTARIRFEIEGGFPGQGASFSGEYVTTLDSERYAAEGNVASGDENRAVRARKIGDRGWVRVEEGGGSAWEATDGDELGRSPADVIGTLRRAERVRQRAREQAAGRRTTHFEAKLPLSALTGADVDGSLPVDVWIDDDGLPVMIRSNLTDLRLELEVLEWGVPVDVAPPAADSTAAP